MGDVVSLVEKAQREVSEDDAKSLQEKMMRGEMTMEDFIKQMKLIRRMGPLKQLLGLLPGVGSMLKQVDIDDKHLDRIEAIVGSMTKKERQNSVEMSFSRRRRIAAGAGVKQEEVNQLIKQFEMVGKVSKQLAGMSTRDRAAAMREMGPAATGELPKGMQGIGNSMFAKGSSHTVSVKDRFKKRKR
jgi:signal recognition particle subunit SRP54